MLANWVKQATATTGTGTMTLGSAETGFIAFGDAFADGDVVHYSIQDGNNREIGIGTYTASGTTLSRDTVLETLVSGTFDNTSPTAISLSGSAVVSVVGSSFSQFKSGSGEPVSGGVGSANFGARADSTMSLAADTLYAVPFKLEKTIYCGNIGFYLIGQPSANLRVALVSADNQGSPHQVIAQSSELVATATIYTEASITSTLLTPGWYYIAFITDTATVGLKATNHYYTVDSPLGFNSNNLMSRYNYRYGTYTYGVIPSDVGANVSSNASEAHAVTVRLCE